MKGRVTALMLAVLMSTMSISMSASGETEGRQQNMDVDCSGYSFEDLFEYNHALFDINIKDDWATADVNGNSWVNESRASVVRTNIDSLFDGVPGGNNSWISTDEREAVREVGPQCIADMYTRIGVREGVPHRGGVDWNDMEYVEEGIGLDEVDLIPTGHPDERDCTNLLASNDCREVPVSATNNLEISMFTKEGESHNARFNQLPNSGLSNFTVALNVTNMTSVSLMFTFPYVDGLRMAAYTIEDDQVENLQAGTVEEIFLPDGSVRVKVETSYDKTQWPMIRNLFFDMTTTPPATNDVPIWHSEAPANNTIIPMIKDGSEVVAITGDVLNNWASDNDAWGLDCNFAESGWSSRMSPEGNLLVTSGPSASGTADCSIVDPYGEANNETRSWTFGQPASFSATAGVYSDSVDVESTPSLLVSNLAIDMAAHQNGNDGVVTQFNLGSTSSTNPLSLSGLSPGDVMVHVMATSSGMLDWDIMVDLGIEKQNTLPVITVDTDPFDGSYATWAADQFSFTLSGTVIDPDGGEVDMAATMCGETTTGFSQNGQAWSVSLSIAKCVQDGVTQYDVTISATDDVGAISMVQINVPDPYASEDPVIPIDTGEEEASGLLPSISIIATMTMFLGAALLLRRD